METVLTFMLIRFALIAGVVVALALAGFAVLLVLRRNRRLDGARRATASLARTAASRWADGPTGYGGPPGRGGARGRVAGSLARVVAEQLDRPAGGAGAPGHGRRPR